ncbi:MAG: hypothetical protein U0936_18985 [Planctomycetaceae bacterium]
MNGSESLSRRNWLAGSAIAAGGFAIAGESFATTMRPLQTENSAWPPLGNRPPKMVTGILTTYFKGSHSDVLIGRLLEGWKIDGGIGPSLKLSSLYIDQTVNTEFGRELAKKHNVPIFGTIEGAVTVGTSGIPVDGVLSIGEHGDYPRNELGQDLYPRKKFFQEITDTFQKYSKVVPVFNDKHLGPRWEDTLWMYQRALEMKVPFMAGSSLVVGYRNPDVTIPMNSDLESAFAIGYAELDRYGIHTLEFLQCMVERRKGGEVGVKAVQCLTGEAIWTAIDAGRIHSSLIDSVAAVSIKANGASVRSANGPDDHLFLIEYCDGFVAGALMTRSFAQSISAGVKVRGVAQPLAARAEERTVPRHPHFAFLLHAVERMIHTGKPTYPVERTVLTSGVLDRILNSRSQGGKRLETPELAIAYTPVPYPHAPNPQLPL